MQNRTASPNTWPIPLNEPLSQNNDPLFIECQTSLNGIELHSDSFHAKEYKFWENYAEAIFDRDFSANTSTGLSKSTLYFSGILHTQTLLEKYFKSFQKTNTPKPVPTAIWATRIQMDVPLQIKKTNELMQQLWIQSITKDQNNISEIIITTQFQYLITLNATYRANLA